MAGVWYDNGPPGTGCLGQSSIVMNHLAYLQSSINGKPSIGILF